MATDGPVTVNLNADQRAHLSKLIKEKLAQFNFANDVLPDYVVVLVTNQKSRIQVNQDLETFLGKDSADAFTKWLWNILLDFLKGVPLPTSADAKPAAPAAPAPAPAPAQKQPEKPAEKKPAPAEKKQTATSNDTAEPPKQETKVSSVVTVPEKSEPTTRTRRRRDEAAAGDLPTKNPSRLLKTAVRDSVSTTDEAPKRPKKESATSSQPAHDLAPEQLQKLPERLRKRLGAAQQSEETTEDSAAKKRKEPIPPLQQDDNEKPASAEPEESARDDDEEMEEESTNQKPKLDVKCLYWPRCQRGDECIYSHPTQNCKFGATCTKPDCKFNHPPREGAVEFKSKVPCKFGFSCPRTGCNFEHPSEPCKFGVNCTRPNCKFAHGPPCKYGVHCTKPGCTFTHFASHGPMTLNTNPIPCKYGVHCTAPACKFTHPSKVLSSDSAGDVSTDALSATLPPTPPQDHQEESVTTA